MGYTNAPVYTIPRKLEKSKLCITPAIDLEDYCGAVVHPITNETITKYQQLANDPLLRDVWTKAMAKELYRLAQGKDGITEGTDTIRFLTHEEIRCIPADRTVTYARIVVDYRAQKNDPNRVRITVGGNLIDYPYELTTRTANLSTSKMMWNSTISTDGARFAVADIANMYLETPLDRYEYMRMPIELIPQEIIDHYDLLPKVKNGFVYMEIRRGMYGLPQAGVLANKLLKERLITHGYYEVPHTPGLFRHVTRPIWFTLVVDDFGIKYVGKQHIDHLLSALRQEYKIEVDWEGKLYCGITLDWNYDEGWVDSSMPDYIPKQLVKYKHDTPKRAQHCPYTPAPIKYGAKTQEPLPTDTSERLDKDGQKYIQQVVGSLLYYARAVDITILLALNEIASQQTKPTEQTRQRVKQLLDYVATHPTAVVRFRKSAMILNIHSDASYLSASNARSRAGGYFFLGDVPTDNKPIFINGAIQIVCTVLRLVAASAAEAELGALFHNAQEGKILRLTLEEMGHPQPPIPIHIDNTTTVGIVNNTIKRQRSRAMEMRYFWLLDAETQNLFTFHYTPGQENLADYPTKHHTGKVHLHVRPYYLHMPQSPKYLLRAMKPSARRGCVKTLGSPYLKRTPLPKLPTNKYQALSVTGLPNDTRPQPRHQSVACNHPFNPTQTFFCPQRSCVTAM